MMQNNKVGRPRIWFTDEELTLARMIFSQGTITVPPACICGNKTYRYGLKHELVTAICEKCGYERVYHPHREQWSLYRGFNKKHFKEVP